MHDRNRDNSAAYACKAFGYICMREQNRCVYYRIVQRPATSKTRKKCSRRGRRISLSRHSTSPSVPKLPLLSLSIQSRRSCCSPQYDRPSADEKRYKSCAESVNRRANANIAGAFNVTEQPLCVKFRPSTTRQSRCVLRAVLIQIAPAAVARRTHTQGEIWLAECAPDAQLPLQTSSRAFLSIDKVHYHFRMQLGNLFSGCVTYTCSRDVRDCAGCPSCSVVHTI